MSLVEILGLICLLFCMGVIGFQFALIAGTPWGHLTQGGQHVGPLAMQGRVTAGISVFLLAAMGLSIASAGCP